MEPQWQTFLEESLWHAKKKGAEYADCRLLADRIEEHLKVENGAISALNSSQSAGFGVRVLVNGSWGFFASPLLEKEKISYVVERAIKSAQANSILQKEKVTLAVRAEQWQTGYIAVYQTPMEIDPFSVSLDQKIVLLASADEAMRQVSEKIFWRACEYSAIRTRKLFASSEGVRTDQTIVETGAAAQAHAIKEASGDTQRRSYPDSHLYFMQGGHELVQKLDLAHHAAVIAKEAAELLDAPYAPAGRRGIIVLPSQLNLHGHETAHGLEADRVLGTEWTLAGGSFLTPLLPEIGKFIFGSEKITLMADSVTPTGVGTYGYDDEGTPAQKIPLVENGIWKGLLTSRETVPQLNKAIGYEYFRHSSGAMRGESYGSWPVIRMVNIILKPGKKDFEELKNSVADGTMMFGTNKSWSIDDVRRHFSFGSEIAWEKVNGKWEVRKNAKYYGDNLHFWRNCQEVCNEKSFFLQGVGSCGKADPLQTMHTGHGSSPAYFTDIQVGSVG